MLKEEIKTSIEHLTDADCIKLLNAIFKNEEDEELLFDFNYRLELEFIEKTKGFEEREQFV